MGMAAVKDFPHTIVRVAKANDLPSMVRMGRRFFDASGYSDLASFDDGSFEATFSSLIDSPDAVVVVCEQDRIVGMAAALLYPLYFNASHRTAQEMLWWVDEDRRGVGGHIFDMLIAEAKKKGAKSVSMIALEELSPSVVGAFYERRGFRPSERSWMRAL